MKIKSQNILIIILALILLSIIAILAYTNYLTKEAVHNAAKNRAQEIPTTTVIAPTAYQRIIIIPTEPDYTNDLTQQNPLLVKYDEQASKRLFNKVLNRQALSQSDMNIKTKTLKALLPENTSSGNLYISNNIKIDYTYGNTDVWEVEVLSTDISSAKDEAVKWFLDQGFSQDFICNYPVEFYLNIDISQELSSSGVIFNPLAPGCQ